MDDFKRKYELAKSRANRLKKTARQSELLLEKKSLDLYKANQKLERAQDYLQEEVVQATKELNVANQRLMQALEEKSHLMASISHEIRTPLNAIVGYSELIESQLEDGNTKQQIQVVSKSAASMMSLLNDILEITQIDVGKIQIKPVITKMEDNLAFIGKMFNLQMQKKSLDWRLNLSELPEYINLDVRRYNQIVTNLVSNAFKYTNEGSIDYDCFFEFDGDEKKHGWLTTVVTDTGIGIAQSDIGTIFDLYEKLPDTQSASSAYNKRLQDDDVALHSLGLGLPICKSLCGLMLGEISCKSTLGEGSEFTFKIPVTIPDNKQASSLNKPLVKHESELRILVADDNLTNQQVIQAQLSQLGQQADIVSNGKQALEKLGENSYDVVFLDVLMPVMGGEKTIIAIRNAEQRIAKHYCIALTASSFQEKGQHLMDVGFDLFLSKPLTLKVLSETLNNIDPTNKSNQEIVPAIVPNQLNMLELDLSFFEEQFGDSFESIFIKIAPTFIQGSSERVKKMSQAMNQGDIQKINFEAHTMKGEALTFGFNELAKALLSLEKTKSVSDAKPIFEDMCLTLDNLILKVEKKVLALSKELSS